MPDVQGGVCTGYPGCQVTISEVSTIWRTWTGRLRSPGGCRCGPTHCDPGPSTVAPDSRPGVSLSLHAGSASGPATPSALVASRFEIVHRLDTGDDKRRPYESGAESAASGFIPWDTHRTLGDTHPDPKSGCPICYHRTLDQVRAFVAGNESVDFKPRFREEAYSLPAFTLDRPVRRSAGTARSRGSPGTGPCPRRRFTGIAACPVDTVRTPRRTAPAATPPH